MSSQNNADRWAMPQRRWHRPTRRGVINSLFLLVTLAGTFLVVAGDTDILFIGIASMLGGFVSNHYRAEEETPYAKGFSQPPDASTQRLIHEHLARGRLPADAGLHELALEYASGWSRRLNRFLLLAPLVATGWCLLCLSITWWFNHRWPESAQTRMWGLTIVVAGAVCWLVCFVPPAVWQWRRLRRLT
ncbi:hypothetical protein [Kineococcus sp. SYSU DK002]|uniref:hypothetical protein n=1 Tax=Kineococcus sp. SYSU DK002 TaxID=3383123 RepID=UPI003D7C4F3E